MGNASTKAPPNQERFFTDYSSLHANKEEAKSAGAKFILPHIESVLQSIPEESQHFALTFTHGLVGDVGAGIVVAAVSDHCPEAVTGLIFRQCGLTDELTLPQLNLCRGLTRVDVSMNELGPKSVAAIVRALHGLPGLAQLSLADTGADDTICSELLGLAKATPSLVSLDVSGNAGITEAGVAVLVRLLDEAPHVTALEAPPSPALQHRTARNMTVARVLDAALSSLAYRATPLPPVTDRSWVAHIPRQLVRPRPSARWNYGHAETIGKRPTMEDAMLLHGYYRQSPMEDLFAVMDGHGGEECAHFVQRALPAVLSHQLAVQPDVPSAIKATFAQIDVECKVRYRFVGTTCVLAYITHDTLWVANAGDSRAVLAGTSGAVRLSVDHKGEEKAERARITAEGGAVDSDGRVEGRLAVSRAFGNSDLAAYVRPEPHISEHRLEPGDRFLLLACDGVFDVFTDKAVVELVSKQIEEGVADPQRWASKVVHSSLKRDTTDNVSVCIVALNQAPVSLKRNKSLSFAQASSMKALRQRRGSSDLRSSDSDVGQESINLARLSKAGSSSMSALPDIKKRNKDR